MRTLAIAFLIAVAVLAEQDQSLSFNLASTYAPTDIVVVPRAASRVNVTGSGASIDIDKLIAIGKAIWQIVKAGQPVVDYKSDWAGAVPKDVDWTDLEGFKDAHWGPFGWTFKNVYGMTTVDFQWKFAWTCKGSYNGHGQFLVNVGTGIEKLYAAWGFTVDVKATVDQTPTNYGTKVDPIAGLNIEVTLDVKTVLQSQTARCRVNVRGDCSGQKVACN